LSFAIKYRTSGFPDNTVPRIGFLYFNVNELIHGIFTAGRAPTDQVLYGDASLWEFLHRASMVPAYIRETPQQDLALTRLAASLDRSEKGAVMYAIGQAMTCIFSRKILSTQFLMHIDRYQLRWNVNFSSRRRPDLFGFGPAGWIVAEAKGRSSSPSAKVMEDITTQKNSVVSIDGRPPAIAMGCVSYFASATSPLAFEVVDPPSKEVEPVSLPVNFDRFILSYYEPFTFAIDSSRREPGLEQQGVAPDRSDMVSADFGAFGLRIGLLRRIYDLITVARVRGDLAGLGNSVMDILATSRDPTLFSDGSLVEVDWESSLLVDDWEY
jgi:hypothetical protein